MPWLELALLPVCIVIGARLGGIALGTVSGPGLAAANGTFVLPTYGTVLAAVSFDRTGTARIGRYLLNQSFTRPRLVATAAATLVATLRARWLVG